MMHRERFVDPLSESRVTHPRLIERAIGRCHMHVNAVGPSLPKSLDDYGKPSDAAHLSADEQ
jgi:hypothetical protein